MPLKQAAEIARRLEECRDTAQRLYGDQYDTTINPVRQVILDITKRESCAIPQAAVMLHKEMLSDDVLTNGMEMLIWAATADLITKDDETRSKHIHSGCHRGATDTGSITQEE